MAPGNYLWWLKSIALASLPQNQPIVSWGRIAREYLCRSLFQGDHELGLPRRQYRPNLYQTSWVTLTTFAYLLRMRSPTKPGRRIQRGSHGIAIANLLIKLPTFPWALFTTLQCSLTFSTTLKANCMRAPLKMSPRLLRAHWRKLSISMLLRSRKITISIHQRLVFTLTASRPTLVWIAALLAALSV